MRHAMRRLVMLWHFWEWRLVAVVINLEGDTNSLPAKQIIHISNLLQSKIDDCVSRGLSRL